MEKQIKATLSVSLTEKDGEYAEYIARKRQSDNEKKKRHNRYGAVDGIELHRLGAQAEMAFLKLSNFPFSSWKAFIDTDNIHTVRHDVNGWEVRSTPNKNNRLILHEDDDDNSPFVLVINEYPYFRFPGWIRAAEGKQKHWWSDPSRKDRHAFFVPQASLEPLPCGIINPWGTWEGRTCDKCDLPLTPDHARVCRPR